MRSKVYANIVKLTIPIAVQTIVSTLLSMVDILIVG